jgi:hypothetical protein
MTGSISKSVIEKLRALWPHDDSPGFSDHPENDIRTHRSMAKWGERAAAVVFFGGVWLAQRSPELEAVGMLSFAALIYAASNRMRQQALRWELQLEREEKERPIP